MRRQADAIAEAIGLERLAPARQVLVLDELHKHRRWKGLLKGLFDVRLEFSPEGTMPPVDPGAAGRPGAG